ncbi:kunitz-type serine protease inhibitor A-like [Rhipicephalus microplus]|uniref:kunitz-type serine protease inhibitor A-like n=1 Tax=Rhipicephalus microplus TaxID=6941 RepID=UPI003F6D6688
MKLLLWLPVILCVPETHAMPKKIPSKCLKQPYVGVCHLLFGYYFYNPSRQTCQSLPAGTCAAGPNLFSSLFLCKKTCIPLTLEHAKRCLRLPVEGPCGPVVVAWYYDYGGEDCKLFNRTICGGKGNDFVTEAKCQAVCLHIHRPVCSLPPKPGPCLGSQLRWYFDDHRNTCQKFQNNRCGKNYNAFTSMYQCMKRCSYMKPASGSIHTEHSSSRPMFEKNSFEHLIATS